MKDTFKPIFSIMYKLLLLALVALPVLAIIDHFKDGGLPLYAHYKQGIVLVWDYIWDHWMGLIIVILTPMLTSSSYKLYSKLADDIRHNQFEQELIRWLDTPYISPLHHLYMRRPPRWTKWEVNSPFRNYFYKFVCQAFRDIVYRRYEYSALAPPGKRPNIWVMVPRNTWGSILIYLGISAALVMAIITQRDSNPYGQYLVLTIPIVVALVARFFFLALAIYDHATWRHIDPQLKEMFGEFEPKVRWMDLYANQPGGRVILDTWKAECQMRQDRDNQHRDNKGINLQVPTMPAAPKHLYYDNPAIPLCPFPSEIIPEWAENYDLLYQDRYADKQETQIQEIRELAKASGGKVVTFERRKHK
ncbi:hypothetical protein J2T17_004450 [Paenibacillus mucilaginosus]|uniref:hypothetical protein n=1 Tax=Paenibacillus mucilaginosus TaxID=61624 RepID=UPI003D1D5C58